MKKILTILLSMLLLIGGATAVAQINRHHDKKTEQTKPKHTAKKQNKKIVSGNKKSSSDNYQNSKPATGDRSSVKSPSNSPAEMTQAQKNYVIQQAIDNMVYVQGGTFMMGATSEQGSYTNNDEKPTYQVTLSDFQIGKTEVTQELWLAVMGSIPSGYKGNLQLPVENVSWDDCQEFIMELNSMTRKHFRLPTEAEWEFAARGGNKSQHYKYSGSNDIDDVAWYFYDIPSRSSGTAGYGTQPVAKKKANELGLYDMTGNVHEWCQDGYGSYTSEVQINPKDQPTSSIRAYRGGCWNSSAMRCRVSNRDYGTQTFRNDHLGLRLAL